MTHPQPVEPIRPEERQRALDFAYSYADARSSDLRRQARLILGYEALLAGESRVRSSGTPTETLSEAELRGVLGLVEWSSQTNHETTRQHWLGIAAKIRRMLGEG